MPNSDELTNLNLSNAVSGVTIYDLRNPSHMGTDEQAYWLAQVLNGDMMCVTKTGGFGRTRSYTTKAYGVRPIVILNRN